MTTRIPLRILLALALASSGSATASELQRCLEDARLVRVARVVGPEHSATWARVVTQSNGIPTRLVPFEAPERDIATALDRATEAETPVWEIAESELSDRICTPIALGQEALDAESRVVVAAGLNYAAHAEEAGGGDVFLFPKPVEPTGAYGSIVPPADVTLLDYEVELGFVLLDDVDLGNLPTLETLLARTAFFVANDVTDREPIIRHKAMTGPGTGFVAAKGQPSFLPAGPWLVRGSDLFEAMRACGADGLGLRLEVDEGDGFVTRQDATTAAMILGPHEILARIGEVTARDGLRSPMPVQRENGERDYPLALPGAKRNGATLPAGSIVLTGTAEGVALRAPNIPSVVARGLLRLRGPLEQFRHEELARAAAGGPGGYLESGDRVRASIDGLGAQIVRVDESGAPLRRAPCSTGAAAPPQ